MNRRGFLERMCQGMLAAVWPFGALRFPGIGHRGYMSSLHVPVCLTDFFRMDVKQGPWTAEDNRLHRERLEHANKAMVFIAKQLTIGFKLSSFPVEADWINITDLEENPLGEIGRLVLRMYATDLETVERFKASRPELLYARFQSDEPGRWRNVCV